MTRRILIALAVILYVGFAVAGNLIVNANGPSSVIYVSALLIGPILTIRDVLHKQWEPYGRLALYGLMLTLISIGSLASYLSTPSAGKVALASFVAFFAAETMDLLVFDSMRRQDASDRVNVSNIVGAAVDSALFPTIAFGAFTFSISFQQWVAKIAGGVIWLVAIKALERAVHKPRTTQWSSFTEQDGFDAVPIKS